MSVINKMLQDLDARGGAGAVVSPHSNVKLVVRGERATPWPLVGAGAVAIVLLGTAGTFGWRYMHSAQPQPSMTTAVTPSAATPVAITPSTVAPVTSRGLPTPVAASAMASSSVVASSVAASSMASSSVASSSADASSVAAKPVVALAAPIVAPITTSAASVANAHTPARATSKAAPNVERAQQPKVARAPTSTERGAAAALDKPVAPIESGQTSSANGQSGAEAVYRRALNSLQEGRSTEAIALLEQALVREPRHEAARQTLVGLLIENKRQDEAMRQLQLGLGLEPRQLSMAMLLARMQIERGGNGFDTLTRSLPFASGNSDFHAFLAAALQRQQRYPEAAEQYQLALRGAPQNGVWLMGLGMSLQADHHASEAVAVFQKAKASNNLSPELSVFVERQLQQLKAE